MPVFRDDLDDEPVSTDPEVTRRHFAGAEQAKTAVTFSADTDLNSIINQIGGSKWTVDYYMQVRDTNDVEANPDINAPATVQQYQLFKNIILNVQTPIENGNYTTVTGEAIINVGITPSRGDCLVATLTGGREAIFIIDNVELKHYNVHSIYWITYKLYKFSDEDPNLLNNMKLKIIKTYEYDPNHVADYSAPVILSSDYKKKLDLKIRFKEMVDHYFRHFLNRERNLLVPPCKDIIILDTLLTSFVLSILNVDDHNDVPSIQRLDVDLSETVEYSIWDVISRRNVNLLPRVTSKIGYKFIARNMADPVTRNISYLRINFLAAGLAAGEMPIEPAYKAIGLPTSKDYEKPTGVKPEPDVYYVLSQAFYESTPDGYGLIERVLLDYLNEKYINYDDLFKLISQYPMWTTLEQYQLIPILMVLVKDAIANTFKSI